MKTIRMSDIILITIGAVVLGFAAAKVLNAGNDEKLFCETWRTSIDANTSFYRERYWQFSHLERVESTSLIGRKRSGELFWPANHSIMAFGPDEKGRFRYEIYKGKCDFDSYRNAPGVLEVKIPDGIFDNIGFCAELGDPEDINNAFFLRSDASMPANVYRDAPALPAIEMAWDDYKKAVRYGELEGRKIFSPQQLSLK